VTYGGGLREMRLLLILLGYLHVKVINRLCASYCL